MQEFLHVLFCVGDADEGFEEASAGEEGAEGIYSDVLVSELGG